MQFFVNGTLATGERMRINSAGNVGIGTTSPAQKIHIETSTGTLAARDNGDGAIWSTLSTSKSIGLSSGDNYAGGSNYTWMKLTGGSSGSMVFAVNNEAMRINYNGNVGIGTTNPTALLTLNSSTAPYIRFERAGVPTWELRQNYPTTEYGFQIVNVTSNTIPFFVGATSGSVGIGTTSPGYKLEVSGDKSRFNNIIIGGTVGGTYAAYADSVVGIGNLHLAATGSGVAVYINAALALPTYINPVGGNVGIGNTSPTRKLHILSTDDTRGILIHNSSTTSYAEAQFSASREYRIGTGGSSADSAAAGKWYVYDATAATHRFTINSDGNVGIGTSSPQELLHIRAGSSGLASYDSRYKVILENNGEAYYVVTVPDNSYAGLRIMNSSTVKGAFEYYMTDNLVHLYSAAATRFYNGSGESMRITSDGNVGIGTTSPSYRLQLGTAGSLADSIRIGSYLVTNNTRQYIGYARADTGLFESSGNGDSPSTVLAGVAGIRIVNTVGTIASAQADNSVQILTHIYNGNSRVALHAHYDGNVGIGTTSPSYKLEVSGDLKITTGMLMAPVTSSLYATDGALSYYATNNGVYLNGAGANGWLRLNSSGVENDVTSINIYGSTYSSSPGQIILRTGGSGRIVIKSDGNVGIGTTAPTANLHVYENNDVWHTRIGGASGELRIGGQNGSGAVIQAYTPGGTVRDLYIQRDGGSVGIGTTSPGAKLHVNGTSYAGTMTAYAPAVHIRGAYYGGPRLQVYGLDADANAWMGLGTDMDGSAYTLSVYYPTNASSAVIFGKYDGTATQYGGFTATAKLSNAGTWTVAGDVVAYGSPSDITLKTNIKPLEGALDKITKLQGVSFTWKENTEISKLTGIKDDIGFIAQEVQEVLPDLVRKNDNGLLSLRDKGIIPILVEAIKELKAEIDILKQK